MEQSKRWIATHKISQMNLGQIIVVVAPLEELAMLNGLVREVQRVVDSMTEHSRTGNGRAVALA